MSGKRHKGDTATYRDLDYKERVQSFNATCRNLDDYVKLQLELDTTPGRSAEDILRARLETLRKTSDRIER